ncbi:MAG: hypothetical protein BIFFINMI_04308 [Phycisphaerae bacterium]|nr:hypothetical protein [Phycisphaerae bacterium]
MSSASKLAAAIAAALLACLGSAVAEDVIVKSINPDSPGTTTQPDGTVGQPQTTDTPAVKPAPPVTVATMKPVGGDWTITMALRQAKVSDEQLQKLQPTIDELSKEGDAEVAKRMELLTKMQTAYEKARSNGVKNPGEQEDIKALLAEMTAQNKASMDGMQQRRDRLAAALEGVCTPEQIVSIKDQFERSSPDNKVRNRPMARDWIRQVTPGVTLTLDQREKIVVVLAPIQEKYGKLIGEAQRQQGAKMMQLYKEDPKTAYQKASAEFAPRMMELRTGLAKEMNEAVEGQLTDEQKRQAAAGREDVWKKSVYAWVDRTLQSFAPAGMTDEQMAKAKDLANGAAEAMLKTDLYDTDGRNALAAKLREDIKQLLTDNQRAKVR